MNIAYLLGKFPVNSETFILDEIISQIELGHQATILALEKGQPSVHDRQIEHYKLIEKTHYLPPIPQNRWIRSRKTLATLIHSQSALKGLNPILIGKEAFSLRPFLRASSLGTRQFDIIHCHFGPLGVLGCQLKKIGALKGKLICTFHGYDLSEIISDQGRSYYHRLFKEADRLITISQKHYRYLKELGAPSPKTTLNRCGTSIPHQPRVLNNKNYYHCLSIARLVEKKGLPDSIEAVAQASRQFPRLQYTIVGDGPQKHTLQNLINDCKMAKHIHLIGWKDRTNIQHLLQRSHFLIAPSTTASNGDKEGIPIAILEAMAQGLPVLSTYHSAIPETVIDGETGYLFPEKQPHAIKNAIASLLNSPEKSIEMGLAGFKRVSEQHSLKHQQMKLSRIYHSTLRS